jgi:hypothetical protein
MPDGGSPVDVGPKPAPKDVQQTPDAGAAKAAPKLADVISGPALTPTEQIAGEVRGGDGAEATRPHSRAAESIDARTAQKEPAGDILRDLAAGEISDDDPDSEPTGTPTEAAKQTEPKVYTAEPVKAKDFSGTVIDAPAGDPPPPVPGAKVGENAQSPRPNASTTEPPRQSDSRPTAEPDPQTAADSSKRAEATPPVPDAATSTSQPDVAKAPDVAPQTTPEASKESDLTMDELKNLAQRISDDYHDDGKQELVDKYDNMAYKLSFTALAIKDAGTGNLNDRPEYRPRDGEPLADFYARRANEQATIASLPENSDMKDYFEQQQQELAELSRFVKDAHANPDAVRSRIAPKQPDNPPDAPDTTTDTPDASEPDTGEPKEKTLEERHAEALDKLKALNIKVDSKAKEALLAEALTDSDKMDNLEAIIKMTEGKVEDVVALATEQIPPEVLAKLGNTEFSSLVDLLKAAESGMDPNSKEAQKMHWLMKALLALGIIIAIPAGLTAVGLSAASKIGGSQQGR